MVYSSSYIYAKETFGYSAYFFKRQLFFTGIGLVLVFFIQRIDFKVLIQKIEIIHFSALILLICTFLPSFGISVKGSHRWLDFIFITIQPGEFVKYTLSLFAIYYFYHFNQLSSNKKFSGALQMVLPLIAFSLQPDFGSFSICLIIIGFIIFISPIPRRYFYLFFTAAGIGLFLMMTSTPYRLERFMSYLNPWQDPKRSGFQIIQSFLAFANGSYWGKGIGNSNEKLFYLPEAYNDFIFSVIGEELGFFVGVLPVLILFMLFLYLGFKIALNLESKLASMSATTIVFSIVIQAVLNMGVVLGLLPTKGLNLPFVSYGGSSLVSNFLIIGVFISAARTESSCKSTIIPKDKYRDFQLDYRSKGRMI